MLIDQAIEPEGFVLGPQGRIRPRLVAFVSDDLTQGRVLPREGVELDRPT